MVEDECSVRLGELSALPGPLRTTAPPSQDVPLRIEPERLCAGLPCPSDTWGQMQTAEDEERLRKRIVKDENE